MAAWVVGVWKIYDRTAATGWEGAERSLRPLVIARKISGGTRSAAGSNTRMALASLAATTKLHGIDSATVFYRFRDA